jgi:type III secretion protein S
MLSAPPIIAASVVGLLVAIVQAATQIQEQTFQYALKFLAVVLTILLTASMLGGALYAFGDAIFSGFPALIRS